MNSQLLSIIPVLPSADIVRDVAWYTDFLGFRMIFADPMYAVLIRENICVHLQWHADTLDDPLLGGSVIRIDVENIADIFNELVEKGLVSEESFRRNTPWNTNEFGFYDLNKNAIFLMEDAIPEAL